MNKLHEGIEKHWPGPRYKLSMIITNLKMSRIPMKPSLVCTGNGQLNCVCVSPTIERMTENCIRRDETQLQLRSEPRQDA